MPSVRIRDGYGMEVRCDSSHPAVIAHFCEEWIHRFSSANISIQASITIFPLAHEMMNPDGTSNADFAAYNVLPLDRERTAQLLTLFRQWQEGGDNASQDQETPQRPVPSQPRRRRQRERDIPQESPTASSVAARGRPRMAPDEESLRALRFEYNTAFGQLV